MSSSAALAAAKKRRNVGIGEQSHFSQRNLNTQIEAPQVRAPATVPQLVSQHDARLFILEKQFSISKEEFALKRDVELLHLSNTNTNTSPTIDNVITNRVEKHAREMISLNSTVSALSKNVNDANTLITTLRASILSQSKEIVDLKQVRGEFNEFVKEYRRNVEENITSDGVVVKESTSDIENNLVTLEIKDEISKI